MDFFIHSLNGFVLKKKNAYALLVFINLVPYLQLSHIIPGVNIMGRKVSVASVNGARDWLEIDLNAAKIITIQDYKPTQINVNGSTHIQC